MPLARMLPRVFGEPASRHGRFRESCRHRGHVVVSLTDPILPGTSCPLLREVSATAGPALRAKRGPGGGGYGTGLTGLIGRRSAASSRCAISARLDSSSWAARCGSRGAGMRFGSGAGGIWNTGSKSGGTGGA
jgi:hypothetical protein